MTYLFSAEGQLDMPAVARDVPQKAEALVGMGGALGSCHHRPWENSQLTTNLHH